ncbi:MAG: protein kinase [Phormidesmis sp.]
MNAGGEQGKSDSLLGGSFQDRLGQRFTVVRELGQSPSNDPSNDQPNDAADHVTYLARDRQQQDQLCVIKEFIPQASSQTSEQLEQAANLLCQLDHEQIPKFYQLPKDTSPLEPPEKSDANSAPLYLAQDFVQGPTYQAVLESRQGGTFFETEITQLLYQLLPVLSYFHSMGVVHRRISPRHVILRQSDGLPVLVGFNARSQTVNPPDDLYGLAAMLLVLATGEVPEMLHDANYGIWRGYETLSPKLGQILKRMLSANPDDRFPTADAVLAALQAYETPLDEIDGANGGVGGNSFGSLYPPDDDYSADGYEDNTVMAIAAPVTMSAEPLHPADSAANESRVYDDELRSPERENTEAGASQALIGLLVVLGIAASLLMLYALTRGNRVATDNGQPGTSINGAQSGEANGGEYSPEEAARKQDIRRRLESQGISEAYFTRLVDQLFYQEYPVLLTSGPNGGRKSLTLAPEDEPLRIRWDNLSTSLLDKLDNNFSSSSRSALGSYSEADRSQWRSLIANANVSDRALNDLVDAKFFTLFPDQSGRDFLTQPVGQLYYAIAQATAESISSGSATETIAFGQNELSKDVSSRLKAGEGRIYLVQLSAGQLLRLNLSAPANSTQISLYPPEPTNESPAVFADSEQTTWSGALTQTGLYELVVINRSTETVDYQLAMSIDKVTSTPVTPPPSTGDTSGETDGADDDTSSQQPNSESGQAADPSAE